MTRVKELRQIKRLVMFYMAELDCISCNSENQQPKNGINPLLLYSSLNFLVIKENL